MTVDWDLNHIGILVKDIDNGIEHFRLLGMQLLIPVATKEMYNNEPIYSTNVNFKRCYLQNEGLRIELIQPVAENNILYEHLTKQGECVVYFEFRVEDLAKEKDRLIALGIPVAAESKREDGISNEIIFDTRRFGNVMMALVSEPVPLPVFKPAIGPWKLDHFGMTVKDTDNLFEYYQMIGFKALSKPRSIVFKQTDHWAIYGKAPTIPQQTRACQFQNKKGTFLLEINSPGDDGSLFREYLVNHGEGVDHAHFLVDDVEKYMKSMTNNSFPAILTSTNRNGKIDEAFFDTRKVGNLCFSLWSGPPPFKPVFE